MATRKQLMDAIEYARANGWVPINGNTLRRGWTIVTPEANRSTGPGDTFGKWFEDTFDRFLFVSVVGLATGGKTSAVLGDARAPWVGRCDMPVSLKRAIEVLTAEYDDEGNAR